jgi:two-component system sensor histidine kinase DegS
MKTQLIKLSQRYVTALRSHLKRGRGASFKPALGLGRQAVDLGLETLELAVIHQQALITLQLSSQQDGFVKRAELFFTEALTPIVATHRAARQTRLDLTRLSKSLGRRTAELAAKNRQLQRGIAERKRVEAALDRSGAHFNRLLSDSLGVQERLRCLTHQVLAAQENERKNLSRNLQDDIVQSLLGINVRLLSLKEDARRNSKGLKNEIASTQRLVANSARSVRKIAREFRNA